MITVYHLQINWSNSKFMIDLFSQPTSLLWFGENGLRMSTWMESSMKMNSLRWLSKIQVIWHCQLAIIHFFWTILQPVMVIWLQDMWLVLIPQGMRLRTEELPGKPHNYSPIKFYQTALLSSQVKGDSPIHPMVVNRIFIPVSIMNLASISLNPMVGLISDHCVYSWRVIQ